VEDWTPEPLVAPSTAFEELEVEKRPVIVGSVWHLYRDRVCADDAGYAVLRVLSLDSPTAEQSRTSPPTTSTILLRMKISRKRLSRHCGHMVSDHAAHRASMARRMCI
jgi:hypothetical protein